MGCGDHSAAPAESAVPKSRSIRGGHRDDDREMHQQESDGLRSSHGFHCRHRDGYRGPSSGPKAPKVDVAMAGETTRGRGRVGHRYRCRDEKHRQVKLWSRESFVTRHWQLGKIDYKTTKQFLQLERGRRVGRLSTSRQEGNVQGPRALDCAAGEVDGSKCPLTTNSTTTLDHQQRNARSRRGASTARPSLHDYGLNGSKLAAFESDGEQRASGRPRPRGHRQRRRRQVEDVASPLAAPDADHEPEHSAESIDRPHGCL